MEIELENLNLTLTSPRQRTKSTITSYLHAGKTFLKFLNGATMPTGKDEIAIREAGRIFRRYFLHRREKGNSERTLTHEFTRLKKLAVANDWPWPFTCDDRPRSEEEPFTPAFTEAEIQALIQARDEYSKRECFYLALSTTWGLRREEIVRIRKSDYNEQTIKIKIAKQKELVRRIEHTIPGEIKPILLNYDPKLNAVTNLGPIFHRILDKADLGPRKGYGWHSIRRSLRTLLEWNLAEARLPPSLVADFMGWSKTQKGIVYGGSPMLGLYDHPEIMSSDPFAIDRLVLNVHPFIKIWEGQQRLF